MSTFLLVHGGMHGAWCWYKVVPRLERLGHRVLTVDLPGHGLDRTPPDTVTVASYVRCLSAVLDDVDERVVLVGHSLGGIAITQTAEIRSERISELVYLSALLPRDGESSTTLMKQDLGSVTNAGVTTGPTGYKKLSLPDLIEGFYHDCPAEDVALARTLLTGALAGPSGTPVRVSDEVFGRVPRTYISCLADRVLTPVMQKILYTASPCRQVLTIDSGHSPFFAAPDQLVEQLVRCGA